MSIAYNVERLADVLHEIKPLVILHWNDVSDGSEGEPDPAWDTMIALEGQGIFKLFTTRDDGKLVGYTAFIIAPHMHYRKMSVAHDDAFFLHRDYRKGGTGFKMFKFAEEYLKAMGVNRIVCHEKLKAPLEKFFNYLGFRAVERNWFKDIQ
jgi:GNAT superfamily N-acetyltransferase